MSGMRARLIRPFRLVVAVFACIGGMAVLTVATPLTTFCAHRLSGPILDPAAPLLIVLTAAGPVDGLLSDSSYWRSVYAIRAWRTGKFQRILLTGEQSAVMKSFLVNGGVPADRIDLEGKANSTRQSALFTAAMLHGRKDPPPVLLTSDYHMFRARKCFEKAGLAVAPHPIPDAIKRSADWSNRPAILVIEIQELLKIGGYRVRGWL
jgi:uncharacterized SAM-binding protein YcdF (DUF218 family)